jgi:biopolymer transport protein ExbB
MKMNTFCAIPFYLLYQTLIINNNFTMKWFNLILIIIANAIGFATFYLVFGQADDKSILHSIYEGGPLVAVLIALFIMTFTYIFERLFSLAKAQGKGSMVNFLRNVEKSLEAGDIEEAITACTEQGGSMALIIKSGIERYQKVANSERHDNDKKIQEVQRAFEEETMLQMPLLERNLLAMATIASIATMVGLLGTVIGMIRAFSALARSGAPDAIALSRGISEALFNTAGGIGIAIIAIVAYNYFMNRVDNFSYILDEANYNITQTLNSRTN